MNILLSILASVVIGVCVVSFDGPVWAAVGFGFVVFLIATLGFIVERNK